MVAAPQCVFTSVKVEPDIVKGIKVTLNAAWLILTRARPSIAQTYWDAHTGATPSVDAETLPKSGSHPVSSSGVGQKASQWQGSEVTMG